MICRGARSCASRNRSTSRCLDRRRIVADLVIARRFQLAQLQPVERRLAGHRRAILAPRRKLARQHRHHRIVAQLVVVVEILVAERDRQTPAARPASPPRARSTPRAARRESTPQTDPSVRSPDPSPPAATLPHPTSPVRHQTPLPQGGLQQFQNQSILRYTLSASGLSSNRSKVVVAQQLSLIRSPDAPI